MPDHLPGGAERQPGHDRGDGDVRPAGLAREHAGRGGHDRDVADRVVAAAQPDRAHIGIALAEADQQQRADEVRGQRRESHRAHRLEARQGAVRRVPDGGAKNENPEQPHRHALQQRRPGAPAERHGQHEQRDPVGRRIAEEIERVRLQGDGLRGQPGEDLNPEHGCVDDHHGDQDPPQPGRGRRIVRVAAAAHENPSNTKVRRYTIASNCSKSC